MRATLHSKTLSFNSCSISQYGALIWGGPPPRDGGSVGMSAYLDVGPCLFGEFLKLLQEHSLRKICHDLFSFATRVAVARVVCVVWVESWMCVVTDRGLTGKLWAK